MNQEDNTSSTDQTTTEQATITCIVVETGGVMLTPDGNEIIKVPLLAGNDSQRRDLEIRMASMSMRVLTPAVFESLNPELSANVLVSLDERAWSDNWLIAVAEGVNGWTPWTLLEHAKHLIEDTTLHDKRFPPSIKFFEETRARFADALGEDSSAVVAYLITMHTASPSPMNFRIGEEIAALAQRVVDLTTPTSPASEKATD